MPRLDDGALPPPPATIHLMGIAGTAMGAFAGMLLDEGYRVTGSDTAIYPPMSDLLAEMGITPMQGFEAHNLDHRPDLVVVGNVVRASYAEAEALLASELPYASFPELLGRLFLQRQHSVVVAGTHGKTTTTAVLAWLLEAAGRHPGFLIGGVTANFPRTARAGAGDVFVVEGDEYDTAFFDKRPKFVHYAARTAILTSVEFDHADIYADLDAVKRSFRLLTETLPADGLLVARWDDPHVREVAAASPATVWRYGPDQPWDGRIEAIDTSAGTMRFALLRDGRAVGTFTTPMVGTHNLYNQVAAAAVAISRGVTPAQLEEGFPTFRGIKRRQQVIGEPGRVTVVDDFAHHPTAVRVTLSALRQRFGTRRLWAIFEPRSATSRRDVFQDAYAAAFDDADTVVVAPPYDQSRIQEADRFDAPRLVRALADRGQDALLLHNIDAIAATVAARAHPHDVVAVLSNGGFGGLHGKLLGALRARFGDERTADPA